MRRGENGARSLVHWLRSYEACYLAWPVVEWGLYLAWPAVVCDPPAAHETAVAHGLSVRKPKPLLLNETNHEQRVAFQSRGNTP